ncbi:DNA polymerase III subunit delta [bacterium]|nr:DNA polymerase III subunit delta [bacterium]
MSNSDSYFAKLDEVVGKIRAGRSPSVCFIFSDDEFLVSHARRKIAKAQAAQLAEGADVLTLPGDLGDLNSILTEILSSSLFSPQKLILVPDFSAATERGAKNKAQLERFARRLSAGVPEGRFCILSTVAGGATIAAFAKQLTSATVLSFPKFRSYPGMMVSKDPLFAFAQEAVTRMGMSISADAFLVLKESVGTDLRTMVNELEKLHIFVRDKKAISPKDVKAVVPQSRQQAAYELADAVAEGNIGLAFQTLSKLIQDRTPELLIVQSLASKFRHLLQAKILIKRHLKGKNIKTMGFYTFRDEALGQLEPLIPKFGSGHSNLLTKSPFIIFKTFKLATELTQRRVAAALIKLSEADEALKSSLATKDELLRDLLFHITGAS